MDHIVAVINDLAEACSGSAAGLVATSVFADNSAGIGTPHACRKLRIASAQRVVEIDMCCFVTHVVAVLNDLVDSMLGVLGRLA